MSAASLKPARPPGRLAALQRAARRGRQRGVAIITALLLTALAITIVASLFWEQQVQVRSMENQRLHLQTKWILRGVLDYARFALRETGRIDKGVTGLDGVWATPIAESRLDDYVEHDRVEDDTYKATFSGELTDAQARFNLTNLANGKVVDAGQVAVFQRLLSSIQVDPSLAQAAAQAIANSQQVASSSANGITTGNNGDTSGTGTGSTSTNTSTSSGSSGNTGSTSSGGSEPMAFLNVEDLLSVPGFTSQVVQQLRPYLIVLPGPTKLNANTAGPEVLAAVLNVSVSQASALVASRKSTGHFTNKNDMLTLLGSSSNGASTDQIDLTSSYFLANSRIRLDRAALDAESLIQRQNTGLMTITLISIREI